MSKFNILVAASLALLSVQSVVAQDAMRQSNLRVVEGANLLFSEVSGCKSSDYVEGKRFERIVNVFTDYSPKCLRVHAGSTVSIVGSPNHPLQGMDPIDGVVNPFQNVRGAATVPVERVLNEVGFYGYYCLHHGDAQGGGMAGSIQVVP